MKKFSRALGRTFCLVLLASLLAAGAFTASDLRSQALAATCTPTGYMEDGINLTAAMIVTTSSDITNTTIDATGCNIGIYFAPGSHGRVVNSVIHEANYYGVLNNSGNVTIYKSNIYNIGDTPPNFTGAQHGRAIKFTSSGSNTVGGSIILNQIWKYQKNGIDVRGNTTFIKVSRNTVTGEGPVNYIAQNGIVIGNGAHASVTSNTVTGNSYTGPGQTASGGILVFGGTCYSAAVTTGTRIAENTLVGNDVGVYLSNLDGSGSSCQPTTTPTHISVFNNVITNNSVTNTTGAQVGNTYDGYQAGVSDQGSRDRIIDNRICGSGYTPVTPPPPFLYVVDISNTYNPTVVNNYCPAVATSSIASRSTQNLGPERIGASKRAVVD
jgi:hypothetical protein